MDSGNDQASYISQSLSHYKTYYNLLYQHPSAQKNQTPCAACSLRVAGHLHDIDQKNGKHICHGVIASGFQFQQWSQVLAQRQLAVSQD